MGGHQGADFISIPGQDVVAIGDGVVLRLPQEGVVIDGTAEGTSYKILYIERDDYLEIGTKIRRGDSIGKALDLRIVYPTAPGMTNHVHLKLRIGGKVVDPALHVPPQ